MEVVLNYFDIYEAEAIMSIAVPLVVGRDRLVWHYNMSGQYSVKSGILV